MDTSHMLHCDPTHQESYRNVFKQQRIKTERIRTFSEEGDPLVQEPPQKKTKKLRTGYPRPPAPEMLELHSEEGFDAASTFSSSPVDDRHMQLDNFNEASEFAVHFTPETHVPHNITRPEPAPPTEMRPIASGSIFPKSEFVDVEEDFSPTEYQTFVMRKLSEISIYMRDISERLQRMEEKIYHTNRGNNNIDTVYDDTELGIPVHDEVNLLNLEAKLHHPPVFNNMIHILKRSGGSNVAIITATILSKLVGNSLAENYSWHGKKQKKPFARFSHIVKLVLSSAHAACSEKQYKCTDADIISAGAKWLAQSKTRSKRIEIRSNKHNGISLQDHVHMKTNDYRNI